jgi:ribose transport system ATP-binding protein
MSEYLLEVEGVSKGFPGVQALDDMHLNLRHNEVLALVGENGAGKSTLMKLLSGISPTRAVSGSTASRLWLPDPRTPSRPGSASSIRSST